MSDVIPDFDRLDLATLRRRRGEKWQLYGPDVLPAWVAEMDFPLAAPVQRVLAAAVVERGWTLLEMQADAPTLEELFVRVVG
jgi:cystathionine beta-lyase